MNRRLKTIGKTLLILYLLALHATVIWLVGEKWGFVSMTELQIDKETVSAPTRTHAVPSPLTAPDELADLSTPTPAPPASNLPADTGPGLAVPVFGVKPEQLIDTYTQARGEERLHEAIDIPAPLGTPVIAAGSGKIIRFHDSVPGGITIYQLSSDNSHVFYYGHLQRRADTLREGDFVNKGATIGFVGDTGNAGAGNYHLHFSISKIADPKRYWEGTYINPYPLLTHPRPQ